MGTSTSLKGMVMNMAQTNNEILEETIPADVVKELGDAREMINGT